MDITRINKKGGTKMAYIKNPTEKQKKEWAEQTYLQAAETKKIILTAVESYQENPETIAELLAFGSKFYKYSPNNNILVYHQNPKATYVQSYDAWKKMGASIKKGEKGIKVYTPVQATVLKIDGKLVPLEQASKDEKDQYRSGEVESITETHFKIGNVFDISQTNYPKEDYPKLYQMGYPSERHADIVKGLVEYARKSLNCSVTFENLNSIDLRGDFTPGTNAIRINELLEDTQKLSTLSHEVGHAILHHQRGKSTSQIEFEADAISIMLTEHFGIEMTETRKRHCAEHYQGYQKEVTSEGKVDVVQILHQVYQTYRRCIPDIQKEIEHYLPVPAVQAKKNALRPDERKLTKTEIYDEIKQRVSIIDYANRLGLTLQRKGRYYSLKEYDSVRIDPKRNCFWRNSGVGLSTQGSIIDFAMAFRHHGDLHNALLELTGMIETTVPIAREPVANRQAQISTPAVKRDLELPERAPNMKRVYAYLLKTRYLDQDVVQDFVDQKMLYQDKKGNCVFVAYDQEKTPTFACKRGTLTDKKFMGDVPGSDYTKDFYIANGSDQLIITESVIDAMSVMSILKGQGVPYQDYDYMALTGTGKYIPILNQLQASPKKEVLLALDNDQAGIVATQNIQKLLENHHVDSKVSLHIPQSKDWNQELVSVASKFKSMSLIPFLEDRKFSKDILPPDQVLQSSQLSEKMPKERSDTLQIKELHLEESLCMATIQYQGTESIEPIWNQGEEYFLMLGMQFDHTLEKHILTESQVEQLQSFRELLSEKGIDQTQGKVIQIDKDGRHLGEKAISEIISPQKNNDTAMYLKQVQRQELQRNKTTPGVAITIGAGLEI